ncbi:MAG TPA: ATP-binding protein [Kofleriaceae bacterium]|nr:ATP-binding protein [Kofleriaceae bacterium]
MTDPAASRVRRLQEVIAKAIAAPSTVEVARVIVEEGVAALGGWIGALWLLDEGSSMLELLHWIGVEPGRRFRRMPLHGESPIALAVRTRTPVWIASRAEYIAAFPQSDQAGRAHTAAPPGELASACLPLVADDQRIGGLMFAYGQQHDFTDDERGFLVTIAKQCAYAIAHLRLLEAKDAFFAMLGHELRNPLAPIVAALDLMKARGGGALDREGAIIERQVRHLVRLVDDLLDVSRIARGQVRLARGAVAVADAVAYAVEAARPLVDERGHRLEVELEPDLVVDADPDRLGQVVANLVTNAAKYTPDGGRIAVSAQRTGDAARIAVRDNGSGIAPELLPRIFELFVQGERAVDRAEGGLGLGLAIVKHLVELHGGRVLAESEGVGRGATFTVWWPCVRAPVVSAAASDPARAPAAADRSLKVLVIDDNVDAAFTLGELLRVLGHQPTVVHDAPSALATASDEPPELALVDLGLPNIDGYELAERLRALPGLARTPFVAVTGYGQPSDRERTLQAGFSEHLVKPVGLEDLRALLRVLAV